MSDESNHDPIGDWAWASWAIGSPPMPLSDWLDLKVECRDKIMARLRSLTEAVDFIRDPDRLMGVDPSVPVPRPVKIVEVEWDGIRVGDKIVSRNGGAVELYVVGSAELESTEPQLARARTVWLNLFGDHDKVMTASIAGDKWTVEREVAE
jgi:hypothetical protein